MVFDLEEDASDLILQIQLKPWKKSEQETIIKNYP